MAKRNDTTTPAAETVQTLYPTSDVRIVFVERENSTERFVCETGGRRRSGILRAVGN